MSNFASDGGLSDVVVVVVGGVFLLDIIEECTFLGVDTSAPFKVSERRVDLSSADRCFAKEDILHNKN